MHRSEKPLPDLGFGRCYGTTFMGWTIQDGHSKIPIRSLHQTIPINVK
jgi:hypothetical protein